MGWEAQAAPLELLAQGEVQRTRPSSHAWPVTSPSLTLTICSTPWMFMRTGEA